MTTPQSSTFDAAALAVATAAGAISVFIAPGPYDLMSVIIGTTLIVIIWAYEFSRRRTIMQSLALSMSTAFISLLVLGLYREWKLSGLNLYTWYMNGLELKGICPIENYPPYTPSCPKDAASAVELFWLARTWMTVSGLVFLLELVLQRERRQKKLIRQLVDERRRHFSD